MTLCKNKFQNITEIENAKIVERFYSKKNEVYKLPYFQEELHQSKYVVVKKYLLSKEKMKKEIDLLLLLKQEGLSVPEIYQQKSNYIIMEYIQGKTLLETIEERERNSALEKGKVYESNRALIESLIEWMEKFYAIAKFINKSETILGDVNLRNFIVGEDEKVYGIDFEDCREGEIQEDITRLCAYVLTYSPSFTPWKIQFSAELLYLFIKRFAMDEEMLIKKVEGEINAINIKRGKL
ncbi:putative protein kinase [Clostridium aceticum]|uniref:non-specific serine/threonine protein kinase n=1 Tax=Clostridium aceticum TaxID=84022 RepID=A0A0D8IEA5_9CLOT|nr:RIO1 family regulatory kinase/ATPase [Clostridium aceticum]AKL94375.1 putative protein kinase [Clostridium aceticum]KJF28394.1 hypothetical protein TZ02_03255 [Clostridium aceticum]